MSTSLSRRRFTRNSLATTAGVLFAGIGFQATRSSLLFAPERQLLSKLTRLFPRILLLDVQHEKGRRIQAAVSIDEVDSFLDPTRRGAALPEVAIRAGGDTLSFHHEGTDYEIRLLLPNEFTRQSGEPLKI